VLNFAPFFFLVCGTTSVPETLDADGADLRNHAQQNIARQYAANFGKHGTKDPLNHHLIQNTESVLVTTTVDLDPPRGDWVVHSGNNVKVEVEPRGFFADQFEVGFFSHNLFFSPSCSARTFSWVFCWPVLRLTTWSMPMTPRRQSFQTAENGSMNHPSIHSLPDHHTLCSRFLPPVDDFYVRGCAAFLRGVFFSFFTDKVQNLRTCFFFPVMPPLYAPSPDLTPVRRPLSVDRWFSVNYEGFLRSPGGFATGVQMRWGGLRDVVRAWVGNDAHGTSGGCRGRSGQSYLLFLASGTLPQKASFYQMSLYAGLLHDVNPTPSRKPPRFAFPGWRPVI